MIYHYPERGGRGGAVSSVPNGPAEALGRELLRQARDRKYAGRVCIGLRMMTEFKAVFVLYRQAGTM